MLSELNSFREWFHGYENQYVIIGGTACLLLMEKAGIDFRSTKDVDLVLIIESKPSEFIARLWEYVIEGGYEHRNNSNGFYQFYRFSNPKKDTFPFMIELFTRHLSNIKLHDHARLTPLLSEGNISDFSAILLDDDYYHLIHISRTIINDISVLGAGYLILLKIKAWLDLTYRKRNGENVDSKNIRKHKNDVFRLSTLLKKDETIYITLKVYLEFYEFIVCMKKEALNTKQLGLTRSKESILEILQRTYFLE